MRSVSVWSDKVHREISNAAKAQSTVRVVFVYHRGVQVFHCSLFLCSPLSIIYLVQLLCRFLSLSILFISKFKRVKIYYLFLKLSNGSIIRSDHQTAWSS